MTEGRPILRTALIWLVLELAAAAQVRGPDGATVLFSWFRGAFRPLTEVGRQVISSGNDLRLGFADARRLVSENRRLREVAEGLAIETTILRADLEATMQANAAIGDLPRFRSIPARCVVRDLGAGLMLVARRSTARSPVRLDMPVVGPGGVVGRVFRIDGPNDCWVQTVTNPAAAVAIASADGSVRGLAEGTGGANLVVRFVSRRSAIMVGDVLWTSGADGIYPPGLPVGEVSRVRESPDPFLDILARPLVDLAVLQAVWLVDLDAVNQGTEGQ